MLRVLVLLSVASSVPLIASAQDVETLIQQGLEARREGRDADAVELFRRAHAIDGSPRALAQLALAEQAHGEWTRAERDLVTALATTDAWILDHRDVLERALETIRSHLGRLVVDCNVAGAEVAIDGQPAGTLPLAQPLSVEAGTVVVTIRAPGHVAVQRSASIRVGELSRLAITLVSEPEAAPESEVAPQEPEPVVVPAVVPLPAPAGPSPLLVSGLVGSGVTALALAATLIAIGAREDAVQRWNDDARCPPTSPGGRLDSCAGSFSTLRSAEDWAVGLGITTGVLAAASAALMGMGLSDAGPSAAVEIGPHAIRAQVRGTF